MKVQIVQINDEKEKSQITRKILETLTEWFGIEESREEYIRDSKNKPFFCAMDEEIPVGFLYLKQTGKDTVELAVMGVLKEYQHQGIGQSIFEKAKHFSAGSGFSFMQVKTVQMGKYECYDKTNLFYKSLGFKELEVFPTLWDEANPCQIYIMAL